MATTGINYNREVRRRRIIDRGSDRLALITGRIHSIPSTPEQQDQLSSDSLQHEERVSGSLLANHDSHDQFDPLNNSEDKVEPLSTLLPTLPKKLLMHKSDNDGNVGSSRAAVLLGNEEESFQVSSSIQTPVTDSGLRQPSRQNLRTANEIRTAISASENTRICCSIAAAILVLLSYTGFPFLGWGIFRSIICFRPLYLLLITNISIVVARLLLERKGSEERQTSSVPSVGGDGMIDQVSKALELGLN
ncbi:uncharacterized protein LOC111375876 [Olea europaea var. sylvestris]|uniref:uncharacterized protein LOC111375876 n=1 Tax=Olea europaea var. sylvestris TaxID=158386 RepID=UPI000C1D04AB|nr:uncharacterized protein LOC111375876 [Olea europaea var. sylvestris]